VIVIIAIPIVVLLLPIATTFGERYNIRSKTLVGACFIPAGIGNLSLFHPCLPLVPPRVLTDLSYLRIPHFFHTRKQVGAPLSGRVSDLMIKKWRKKRAGRWVAEDRLRASLFGAIWIPLSTGLFGIANTRIHGRASLVVCLVCLFINGIGVDVVLTPIVAYNVDVLHAHSAEVMSAHSGVRNMMLAILSTLIVPSIERWGVLVTNSAAAVVLILGALVLWLTIRFGEELRACVDVGYSNAAGS